MIIIDKCPKCNGKDIVYHGNDDKQCVNCLHIFNDPFVEICQLGHAFVVQNDISRCPECKLIGRLPEHDELFYGIIENMLDNDYTYSDIANIFSIKEKRINNVLQKYRDDKREYNYLTRQETKYILKQYKAGMTKKEIASNIDRPVATVHYMIERIERQKEN